MITLQDSTVVERPMEAVFAFIADVENLSAWQTGVVKSTVITPGPTRAGTRFTEDVRVIGRHMLAECEVTEFEPPMLMAFRALSSAPIQYGGRIVLTPLADHRTRIDITATARLKGVWRIAEPLFGMDAKNELKKELKTIKTLLESNAPVLKAS